MVLVSYFYMCFGLSEMDSVNFSRVMSPTRKFHDCDHREADKLNMPILFFIF